MAHGHDPVSRSQTVRVAEVGHGEVFRIDLEDCQVGQEVPAHHGGVVSPAVGQPHQDLGRALDYVEVGQDIAVRPEDYARSRRLVREVEEETPGNCLDRYGDDGGVSRPPLCPIARAAPRGLAAPGRAQTPPEHRTRNPEPGWKERPYPGMSRWKRLARRLFRTKLSPPAGWRRQLPRGLSLGHPIDSVGVSTLSLTRDTLVHTSLRPCASGTLLA